VSATIPINSDYIVEIDTVDEDAWSQILVEFNDSNLYQTWTYGSHHWRIGNLSHFLLRRTGTIVAAAQVLIVRIPYMPGGIAYIRWGGMWQRKDKPKNLEVLRQMLRALRMEYAYKRGLLLRILPNIIDIEAEDIIAIFREEGYRRRVSIEGGRTLYVNLQPSLEELRSSLKPRWRSYLKRAEKSDLALINAPNGELYEIFLKIYREMHRRKRFIEYVNVDEFQLIQQNLPDAFKLKILACQSQGEVHAAIICAALGDTGIYVLGATSDKGLKSRGSYLLHWKMIEWLKDEEYKWYDLGGIDPVMNPGTAQFKYGLAGKKGIDCHRLGHFDTCTTWYCYPIFKLADSLRLYYRKVKNRSINLK
jgi:hypothetical protein